MAGYKPNTSTIPVQETRHTFLADSSIKAEHVGYGCALVMGGTQATVKLLEAGDVVFGKIETVEIPTNPNNPSVVNVLILGGYRLKCADNADFEIGDTVIGGADGLVAKGAAASTDLRFFVADVDAIASGFVGVIKL